jgi:cytochrome P450
VPALADAPYLDLFDEQFRADPASVVDRLRADAPLVQTQLGCMVIARRHVHALLSDTRLRSALVPTLTLQGIGRGPLLDMVSSSLLALDGDDHARVRRLVSRSFTPRAADTHRPVMRRVVDDLVEQFAPAGRCEFMADFADHYPVQVICHLLGVPTEDHSLFARWGDELTYLLSLEASAHLASIEQAFAELNAYIDRLVAERRDEPADDLVTQLVEAREGSDALSGAELRALVGGLLFAGYDTTRNQLGIAMTLFCEHPDQWSLLADRPELAPQAVEEVMRVAGTVRVTPRLALDDIDVDGWLVPKGTLVALSLASANHDADAYDDPHRFDISAEREAHLTFGGGPHFCLGASLARAEMQEALPVLAGRLSGLALDGEPEWRPPTGIYGPTRLPLRFNATTS